MRRIVSTSWHIVEETMDDTDRRLIGLLRENAVQNRIDRLTADGVIGGFTVRLKPEAEPQRVRAITMVARPNKRRPARSRRFFLASFC
jgi:DNA-binding Lrp family transcriptional regulator